MTQKPVQISKAKIKTISKTTVNTNVPTRSTGKILLGLICLTLFVFTYWISPYWNLYSLKQNIDTNDVIKFSDAIDFPSVRENLKNLVRANIAKRAGDSAKKDDMFGMFMVNVMIDPIVNSIVTPEGLMELMHGKNLRDFVPNSADKTAKEEPSNRSLIPIDLKKMRYEKLDRFTVILHRNSSAPNNEEFITLIFQRHGLFSWLLTGFRFNY